MLLGKVLEVSVENSNHSIILAEVQRGIEIVNSEALTIVAGGTSVPIVKVQDSREISVIGHLDAIKEPLETHGSTGVTLFAVQDISPNSGPEYVARQSFSWCFFRFTRCSARQATLQQAGELGANRCPGWNRTPAGGYCCGFFR